MDASWKDPSKMSHRELRSEVQALREFKNVAISLLARVNETTFPPDAQPAYRYLTTMLQQEHEDANRHPREGYSGPMGQSL